MLWKQQQDPTAGGVAVNGTGTSGPSGVTTKLAAASSPLAATPPPSNHLTDTLKRRREASDHIKHLINRGTVLYPFEGSKLKTAAEVTFLDLELGEVIIDIWEKEVAAGWSFGTKKSTKQQGLFPTTYVVRMQHEGQQFLDKIAEVCREWGEMWKKLYVDVHSYQFEVIRRGIDDLMEGRRQILNQSLTQDQYREVAKKICSKIDWGNRKLGLDLVPWAWLLPEPDQDPENDGEVVVGKSNTKLNSQMWSSSDALLLKPDNSIEIDTGTKIGAGRLFKLHTRSVENAEVARGSNTMGRPKSKREQHNNLCISIRDFNYVYSDDCEIIVSLHDGQRFISERHTINHGLLGQSNFHMNEDRQQWTMVFQQVPTSRKDFYLVCHIVRIGRMHASENSTKKLAKRNFRRPFCCGIIKLTDVEQLMDDDPLNSCSLPERIVKMYSCEEKDYWQIHELIISNSGKLTGANCLLSVAAFWNSSSTFTGSISGSQKVSLIDSSSLIVPPGLVRNDVYITLVTVDLIEKKPNKTGSGKHCNVEVEVQVINEEEEILADLPGNCYKSLIFYHQNSPKFMETMKFNIPIEYFPKSRLRLLFRHCSAKDKAEKKLFGVTWLSLMDTSGTTLNNGDHTIHIYKWADENSMPKPLANSSLSKDSVTLNSLIISTKFTQNIDLVNLLKWKQTSNLKSALQNLIHSVEATEEIIRKFLPDVLDALFTVFSDEEGNSTENSGDVFTLLVNIFQMLKQPSYSAFKAVLNTYCNEHFAAALVYKGLLQSLRHYTTVFLGQEGVTEEINNTIRNCYFSLEYIFKFIVQSQELFARATGGHLEDSFRRDVKILVSEFCKVFAMPDSSSAVLVGTRSMLLQNLHSMYEELMRVMQVSDVCELICEIFNSIPLQDTAGHPLSPAKLQAIHRVVKCTLFKNSYCRTKLLPVICKHIRHHLQHREELKLCTEVLNDILIYLHAIRTLNKDEAREAHADVEVVCTTTLEMLVQAVLVLERTSSVVGNLVTCLVGLLEQMDSFHYNRLWDEFHERKPLRDLLLRIFLLFRDLIKQDVFPSDWAVMKLLTNHVMLITLQQICSPLATYFINMFDVQLWTHYFNLAVIFISQPCLQLETFRESKREMILSKYGDMRLEMGQQMLQMWAQLSDSEKRHFIPSLVGPFLEVTMIPEPRLRSQTLSVFFYDMMKAEYRLNGNFKETESELIDKLDSIINCPDTSKQGNYCWGEDDDEQDSYRKQFKEIHLNRLAAEAGSSTGDHGLMSKVDNVWNSMCAKAVESFSHLLQLLLDYRHIANLGNLDENRDKLMQCTVNLLKYYQEENRTDQYFRYVYKLHDLHVHAQNFTEAGFTLLLHGDHLNWDWERVLCETWDGVQYCRQREAERKEYIYHQVLSYFDQGKMWEKGIPLCKELANEYERRYDYTKLSKILQMQASFYDNILCQFRTEPEYFRVSYLGKGFPPFVRNKEFVYRGLEYERLSTFISRIVAEWPSAELLQKITPPDPSLLQSDGQYIQICNVKPIPTAKKNIILGSVPEKIRSFYRVNDVNTFQFDRRIQKLTATDSSPPPPDDNNEFKYMWIERTTMKTNSELPSVLRWLEIVEKEVEELSPIEFACEKMEEANSQLQTLIDTYRNDEKNQAEIRSINPLSMKLQGMLDAAVQGGIPKYTDAFFNEEFLKNNDNETSHLYVARLVTLLSEQVQVLQNGLEIHGRLVPPGVQPLHKRLLECHADMKNKVLKTEGDMAAFFAAYHAQNSQNGSGSQSLPNNPLRRSESGNNLMMIRDSFRRVGSKSIINSPLPPVPKVNGSVGKLESKSVSNRSSVCSNDYGQLMRPHYLGEDEYDDVYSQPVEDSTKPPVIPSRLKKRVPSCNTDGGSSSVSNEYIVMPPSRLREIGAADTQNRNTTSPTPPPKPPPKPANNNGGATTPPPPILPRKGQMPNEPGAMLGSKTPSTTSLASGGGGGTGGGGGATTESGGPELSPSKRPATTPPPIPPKPKQSQNNKQNLHHSTYLNREELMRSMENEDKLNENSTTTSIANTNDANITAAVERSPSRNSGGGTQLESNGTMNRVRKSQPNKEFYTLPGKEPITPKENNP